MPSTLYYNAAIDTTWDNVLNWWQDSGFSVPALSIPVDGDTATIEGQVSTGPSVAVTLAQLLIAQSSDSGEIDDAGAGLTSTANVLVGNTGASTSGVLNAFVTAPEVDFYSYSGSTTDLDTAVYHDGAESYGGSITNATFNDFSQNYGATVTTGVFNDGAQNGATVTEATFNDTSYNLGSVSNATFTAENYSDATILNPQQGSVSGTVLFSATPSVTFTLSGSDIWAADASGWTFTGTPAWVFSGTASNSGNIPVGVFNDTSFNSGTVTTATFNDTSYNNPSGQVVTPTFQDSAYNQGTVSGVATYVGTAAALQIFTPQGGTFGSGVVVPAPSDILGSGLL